MHAYNGCEYTLVILKDGRLVSFGQNCRGQLGHSNKSPLKPQAIRGLGRSNVFTLSCSYYHTIVACSDNGAFSFGRNDHGQLGHGDLLDKKKPHEIKVLRGVFLVTVACGQYHTCAGTRCDRVSSHVYLCSYYLYIGVYLRQK